jgi:hypothetical protein
VRVTLSNELCIVKKEIHFLVKVKRSMSEKGDFDLDEVLDKEIKFGKYQLLIFALIAFPIALNGIFSNAYIFTAGKLNYR